MCHSVLKIYLYSYKALNLAALLVSATLQCIHVTVCSCSINCKL